MAQSNANTCIYNLYYWQTVYWKSGLNWIESIQFDADRWTFIYFNSSMNENDFHFQNDHDLRYHSHGQQFNFVSFLFIFWFMNLIVLWSKHFHFFLAATNPTIYDNLILCCI